MEGERMMRLLWAREMKTMRRKTKRFAPAAASSWTSWWIISLQSICDVKRSEQSKLNRWPEVVRDKCFIAKESARSLPGNAPQRGQKQQQFCKPEIVTLPQSVWTFASSCQIECFVYDRFFYLASLNLMVYLVYSSRTSNRSDFTWKVYHNEFFYVSPSINSQKLAAIWWEVKGNYVIRSTCARLDSASLSSLKRIKAFRQVSSILSTLVTNNWTMILLWDVTCSLLIFITSSKTIRSWLRSLAMASSLESGRLPERRPSILVVSVKISNYTLVW